MSAQWCLAMQEPDVKSCRAARLRGSRASNQAATTGAMSLAAARNDRRQRVQVVQHSGNPCPSLTAGRNGPHSPHMWRACARGQNVLKRYALQGTETSHPFRPKYKTSRRIGKQQPSVTQVLSAAGQQQRQAGISHAWAPCS